MLNQYGSRVVKRIDRFSSGESLLLRLVCLGGEPVHPSDLRERTCLSSARVAAILGTLEHKGLITREMDLQDRRRILVHITNAGREQAQREIAEMNSQSAAVFTAIGRQDTEEFIRLLGRVVEALIQTEGGQADIDGAPVSGSKAAPATSPAAAPATSPITPPATPPAKPPAAPSSTPKTPTPDISAQDKPSGQEVNA
jgi:DNA-binding MarR family transcriptional regulator